MKIIEHGKVFSFECKSCRCRYVAGLHEITDCGFFYRAICPECGSVNEYKDNTEKQDTNQEVSEV